MMRPLFMIICLLIGCSTLQSQVTVSAALDNSKALIGDQTKLHLEANYPTNHIIKGVDLTALDSIFAQVDPSKEDPDPGMLEILNQTEWETLTNGGTTTYRKDITLTCWKEGVYFIPQIRFAFELKGTNFTRATNKLTLLVGSPISNTEAIDTVQIAPIKDIISEKWRFSDFLPILYILGGFILVVLAIVFAVAYFTRKKSGPAPVEVIKRPAHIIAFEKLNQLKAAELWQKGEVKAYQSQLTYITREYIENRYDVPALESTTGVILKDLKKGAFPDELVDKMREMLQLADMVKFAKAKPPEEMHRRLMEYAEEIVETTQLTAAETEQRKLQALASEEKETVVPTIQYAHPAKRLLAYILDMIFFQLIYSALVFVPGFFLMGSLSRVVVMVVYVIAFFVIGFVYFVYMHSKKKQTLGKKMLNIEVTQVDGKNISMGISFLRFILQNISALIILPFLPIFFNKQKQTLYDILCKSIVVQNPRSTKKS